MRIVFIGSVEFSRHCLETVLQANGNVVGVVTQPPDTNGFNADAADLASVARQRDIPVLEVRKINDPEVVDRIRALTPDIFFVFGFSQLVGLELMRMPPMGAIGVHPSLLPEGRGRHPLIWTLVKGLSRSGLSFFWIGEGADDGPLLWQEPFEITTEDNAASLYQKIKELAAKAIPEFLPQLENGTAPRIPQDESQATIWRKRNEADGVIRWSGQSSEAYNLIRALTRPYVGAHTFCRGQRLTIWRARIEPAPTDAIATAGAVIACDQDGPLVRTGDGALRLLEIQGAAGLRIGDVLHEEA